MPTPIEILTDKSALFLMGLFASMIIWEAFFPGRKLEKDYLWKAKGLVAFLVFFLISAYLPMFWTETLIQYQVFNLTHLGTVTGAIVGVLVYEFGGFLWHQALHKSDFLWKYVHRTHHSAERLDTFGAFYFSPLDMVGWTALSSLCLTVIVGLSPAATSLAMTISFFFSIFQHMNVKTPRWLGFLVQRPESHTYHHGQNIHRDNYSSLPVFDMLFGTFKNPKGFEYEVGLKKGLKELEVKPLPVRLSGS